MLVPTIDQLQEMYRAKGYVFFTQGDFNLNIFGIRTLPGRPDVFDDTIGCAYKKNGTWVIQTWQATTDPGLSYLQQTMGNPEGTFILCPGQYRGSHVVGRHRGAYPALVQSREVRGWRDRDKDGIPDREGRVVSGVFGINIHHAGIDSPKVANWSAGCLVIKRLADWNAFWALVTRSATIYGERFTYTLFEV